MNILVYYVPFARHIFRLYNHTLQKLERRLLLTELVTILILAFCFLVRESHKMNVINTIVNHPELSDSKVNAITKLMNNSSPIK